LVKHGSKFVKLINAVNTSNWVRAASEMKNSLWARQVGRRAVSNIYGMKTIVSRNQLIKILTDIIMFIIRMIILQR
jgi:hypothetical protein